MSESQIKTLRKQLRNTVQDILPDLVKSELGESIRKELSKQIHTRLDVVVKEIQTTLATIDQRSKDVQSYLVRATLNPAPAAASTGETVNEESKEAQ